MTMSTPSPVLPHNNPETPDPSDRRRFLRRLTGFGAGVVGAIAVTFADAPSASAYTYGCCDLVRNTPCGGHWNTSSFSCPSGYTKRYWSCCCGYFIYHCYECTKGSSCYYGPYAYCSNYWAYYLGGCCKSGCGC